MHQKRLSMNKLWPIPRKGNKFVVVSSNNKKLSIPLLIAMRDILEHVQTRKELKKIILEGKVKVNNMKIKNDRHSLLLFDILSLPSLNKYYRVSISNFGKISFEEVKKEDSGNKVSKIIGKKILSKGKMQLNLGDGNNLISNEKVRIGDSVIINLKDKKIHKILPIVENSEVLIILGKHLGKRGRVLKILSNEFNISIEGKDYILNKDAIMVFN